MSESENFKELYKIRTILRGLTDKYLTTMDLSQELNMIFREAIAIITAK